MVAKPVVFISSTSDLRSARELVGKVLYSMGYEPVWQDIEATDGGELLDVLRKRIAPCSLLVQLVGERYGAEPPAPTSEFGRVSYTQFEALYAEKLGRKVVYHFIDYAFPTDPAAPEPEDRRELQAAYRQQIKADNKLRQSNIASTQDLELSIRRISDELAQVRKLSDRRFRRMLWLGGCAAAGTALVIALILAVLNRQDHMDKQLATVRADLRAAIAPRPMAQGQSAPEPLSSALIEKAKILHERGDAEDQVISKIILKQHADAERMIDDLMSRPGNPIEDALRLLTLRGSNWYQAGDFDKAIDPYETALRLRPDDIEARNNVALAHTFARLGSIEAHQNRAIEICEHTLKIVASGSQEWAMTQYYLGIAWTNMPTGDQGENLRKAMAAYEAALTVFTKADHPVNWAFTQNNVGTAWRDIPTGDRGENLRKAIAAYEAALTVFTKSVRPVDWAMAQNNLGNAWASMPTGDRGENLRKAMAAYEAALSVFTKAARPVDWARTQNNLGNMWQFMPTGDPGENLRKAMAAYETALTVFTKSEHPVEWAMTQSNLGLVWDKMLTGDRGENLRKALAAFEAALTIYTKSDHPVDWAMTQRNLGVGWQSMPTGDRSENLRKAIAAYEAALMVHTKSAHPVDWAMAQNNVGNAWQSMPTGDRGENLRKAMAAYDAAQTVFTKSAHPVDWANTQTSLGNAWQSMPTGDPGENLRKGIEAYEAALTVHTKSAQPVEWANTQIGLGNAWQSMPAGDRGENLRKAVAAYEAALTVHTKSAHPGKWAMTQQNLGVALADLANLNDVERIGLLCRAIASGKAALTVYTAEAYPREHADCIKNLGIDRAAYEKAGGNAVRPFDQIEPTQ